VRAAGRILEHGLTAGGAGGHVAVGLLVVEEVVGSMPGAGVVIEIMTIIIIIIIGPGHAGTHGLNEE